MKLSRIEYLAFSGLVAVCLVSGCVSQSTADARARAAFMEGQRQISVSAPAPQIPLVSISGFVKYPSIPWTPDLTLARALATANYQGAGDPSQIVVWRNGESVVVDASRLLRGEDMPLQPGDRIDIRP